MLKPHLLHFYQRGRADRDRGKPWLHAPQSPEDVQLCGECPAQDAYWQGYGGKPVGTDEPAAVGLVRA